VIREVKAVIRPQRLDHVMEALHEIPDLPGVTVSKVHAYSGSRSRDPELPPESVETDFTKLEIVPPVEEFMRIRDVGGADSGVYLYTGDRTDSSVPIRLLQSTGCFVALALRAWPSPTPPRRTAWSAEGLIAAPLQHMLSAHEH